MNCSQASPLSAPGVFPALPGGLWLVLLLGAVPGVCPWGLCSVQNPKRIFNPQLSESDGCHSCFFGSCLCLDHEFGDFNLNCGGVCAQCARGQVCAFWGIDPKPFHGFCASLWLCCSGRSWVVFLSPFWIGILNSVSSRQRKQVAIRRKEHGDIICLNNDEKMKKGAVVKDEHEC